MLDVLTLMSDADAQSEEGFAIFVTLTGALLSEGERHSLAEWAVAKMNTRSKLSHREACKTIAKAIYGTIHRKATMDIRTGGFPHLARKPWKMNVCMLTKVQRRCSADTLCVSSCTIHRGDIFASEVSF